MPITVQHGPNQSRYASVIAQSAKQTENYERMKQIAEFMQAVKQQNREYELGTEQNRLTGRGQDITYDLGLKDVGLRNRGYDIQETGLNQDYALGVRAADDRGRELTLQEKRDAQALEIADMNAWASNPSAMRNRIIATQGGYYTAGGGVPLTKAEITARSGRY